MWDDPLGLFLVGLVPHWACRVLPGELVSGELMSLFKRKEGSLPTLEQAGLSEN